MFAITFSLKSPEIKSAPRVAALNASASAVPRPPIKNNPVLFRIYVPFPAIFVNRLRTTDFQNREKILSAAKNLTVLFPENQNFRAKTAFFPLLQHFKIWHFTCDRNFGETLGRFSDNQNRDAFEVDYENENS